MTNRLNMSFDEARIVGVSSTQYHDRNDLRFQLALETAENWRDVELPYIAIDSSPYDDSGDWVSAALRSRGVVVEKAETPGVATQRLQGVALAAQNGAQKILGYEAEKVRMTDFLGDVADALDEQSVVVIGRTELALESLPVVQRRVERLAGWVLERSHGMPADALSGGRGFNVDGARILSTYPAERDGYNNWLYLYDTPLAARASGLGVSGIKVDLIHPTAMTNQEEGDEQFDTKRYAQLKLQLEHMLTRSDVNPDMIQEVREILLLLANIDTDAGVSHNEKVLSSLEQYVQGIGFSL